MSSSRRALVLLLALLLAATGTATWVRYRSQRDVALTGVVVDAAGAPVSGVVVSAPTGRDRTGGDGRFRIPGERGLVRASGQGWVTRTRAVAAGRPVVIRLVRRLPGSITFTFGGDVMFGRRFYDPDEDGTPDDGLLSPGAGVAAHERLLRDVVPLLDTADVTAVNLETPLINRPWYSTIGPRPARFHPTKDFAFASAPTAARALRAAGVDVVDLGNNHLYDALERGVRTTLADAAAAGFAPGSGAFGAGPTARSAWQPAVREVGGHEVAFVGCTSILGDDQPLTYVARRAKGGAAACSPQRLAAGVRAARRQASVVVVMIHGGFEYGRDPSRHIRRLSRVARRAGATLVVNHHPHVTGGLDATGAGLTAWTLGNLLFDQTVWPTFDSYVLNVVVTAGKVTGAWVEPLRIQGFRPVPVTGEDADWVARGTLARSRGPWVVDDGSLWLDTAGAARTARTTTSSPLSRVTRGCAAGAGRDLLWTGDFERRDLRQDEPAPLWDLEPGNPYRKVTGDAAHHGRWGVLLDRASPNESPVVLTPQHRQLVTAGDRLTLLLDHKQLFGRPEAYARLSWYNDTRGPSQEETSVRLPVGDAWRTARVDVVVPANAVAVQPFIALAVPGKGVAQMAVDDVRLVDWDEPGCDYVLGGATVTSRTIAPVPAAPLVRPVQATSLPVPPPAPLPPGPLPEED